MSEQWYYQAFNQEFGPLTLDELAQMLHEGALSRDDMVREGEGGSWCSAAVAKSLTGRANEIAAEHAEVATDIDSFMLISEKRETPPNTASQKPGNTPEKPAVDARGMWYFQSIGQEFGPVPFSELKDMAERGEIGPDDSVRKGEAAQWVPAGLIDGLFPEGGPIPSRQVEAYSASASSSRAAPTATLPVRQPVRHPALQQPVPVQPVAPRPVAAPTPVPQPVAAIQPVAYSAPVAAPAGWFCYLNDQEIGPMDITEIQGYMSTGQITPEVYVKYGSDGEWALAAQIPQLSVPAPAIAQPAAQPLPQQPAAAPVVANKEHMELAQQLLALLRQEGVATNLVPGVAAPNAAGWFCNISGSIMGPVTIEALVQMVLQKRIFPDDLIRLGTQGEWFPAKTFPELFPQETPAGKKKPGQSDGIDVLAKIDQMYRDAQEAKEKQEAEKAAKGPAPVTAKVEPPKPAAPPPARDVFRNINSNIARAAVGPAADKPRPASGGASFSSSTSSSSKSSSGSSMGEQLNDLLSKIGMKGKGLYILLGLVVIGAGAFAVPMVLSSFAASSTYDAFMEIHAKIEQAHTSGVDAAAWDKEAKDLKTRISALQKNVGGGKTGSALKDVSRMGGDLKAMVDYAAKKPAAGAKPGMDPYESASKSFDTNHSNARKKLSKKK